MNILRGRRDGTNSAIVLLIVSSVLWGSGFVAIKIGLDYINPFLFAFLRMAVAGVIQLGILASLGGLRFQTVKERSVWLLGLLNAMGFSLQFAGMQLTTAAKTALLVDMNVVFVALLSKRFSNESFGLRKQVGVVVAIVGAVMITTGGNLSTLTQGQLLGDVLVFSSGLVWAGFMVLHKFEQTRHEWNAVELSALVMMTTAVLLMPAALLLGGLNSTSMTTVGWGWVAYTAIATTVVPYVIWIVALRAVTATIAAVVGIVEVVTTMILSSLLLGETYGTVTLVGAILVLLSLLAVAEI